jgi:tRNA U34 5-methylaminomethyl-2-thiouridine-forming methyltransferase MnmC
VKLHTVQTEDNSWTLKSDKFNECYHSYHGAVTESSHVFIKNGLLATSKKSIRLLEVGFGTGLNAVLSHLEADRRNMHIDYYGIELYPPPTGLLQDYYSRFEEPIHTAGLAMTDKSWNETLNCGENFTLLKIQQDFQNYLPQGPFDLVYFDAFSPDVHPEAWTKTMFSRLAERMNKNALLATYSSRGSVKENLRGAGFFVKRYAGPPGKRHIIRAEKL